ncbi:MAG: DnaA regulatory inactivator Hda [Pseudoxanthomonas suwonensis]|nr:DnaA regulatory inactivator Hda [Pseudoxanthomonas suwonensis]
MVKAQLPLRMPPEPEHRFDTFVDAPAGLLSWLQALATPTAHDACGYLQGPAGSGKTHLLLATCAHARAAGADVAYLPLARLGTRLPQMLQATAARDLVALDDVDAVAGDGLAEQALFDFHNRSRQQGTRLLYAACQAPAQLPIGLPDLRSRLAQCTRATLVLLDDEGRARLLQQRAARRGLSLDPPATDWLLRRVGRDLASLTALLERMDAASLAAQRRITVPFLRELLKDA